MKLLALLLVFISISVINGDFNRYLKKCKHVMEKHGLSERFPAAVAHGIHSITLEDIQHYFKPNATEDNKVPTLNYDATSKQPLLRNAPLYGYDKSFDTLGMRRADQILTHMDNKMWDLKHYNTLEKLVHALHMDEVWAKTKLHYDHLKEQGVWTMDKVLCKCINDIDNNGIVNILHYMILKIRYPELTYKNRQLRGNPLYRQVPIYHYSFFVVLSPNVFTFNFTQDVEDNLKRAQGVLVNDDEGAQHLDSKYQWQVWKRDMKSLTKQDHYELAMFLYCTLNRELEHEYENGHFHYEFKVHK